MTDKKQRDQLTKKLLKGIKLSEKNLEKMNTETLKELHNCIHHESPKSWIIANSIWSILTDRKVKFDKDLNTIDK